MSEEATRRRHRRRMAGAAIGVALLGSGIIATTAGATHETGGSPAGTTVSGNISQCPAGTTLLFAPNGGDSAGGGVTATHTDGGRYLTLAFDSSLTGAGLTVYVKGGTAYTVYSFTVAGTVSGLHAPLNKKGSVPAVSHYLICQTAPPPEPEPDPDPDLPPAIFLGYADDFHANDGTKVGYRPSPWAGDPNVVYIGCTGADCGGTSGKFDAGAIRIDNPGTNTDPMTLVSASVDIGPCAFNPWAALLPQTANPGQMFVLTQTGTNGPPMPEPCASALDPAFHAETNFDTSERPGDTRLPSFYDCNPEVRHKPVIHLNFASGLTLNVVDEAMVLNTGGTDVFACLNKDEATPWTGPIPYTP